MPKRQARPKRRIAAAADVQFEKKLRQLQEKLLRSLRKGVRGIRSMDQITHDNVHLVHERMEALREQIQAVGLHVGQENIIDFREADLHNANLVGVCFYRMNLEGANLQGSFGGDFAHVSLKTANLRGARPAGLAYADLTDADLQDADLREECLLGATLDGANLARANLCGAQLINVQADGTIWDDATFDAKTRFSPGFALPAELVWLGPGTDPRSKKSRSTQRSAKTKKVKRGQSSKGKGRADELSLKCVLTDRQLAKLCKDLENDPALPDGVNSEHMQHPLYGPDLSYSIALEYCPNRFRDLDLTSWEYDFNVWYRAERFAQLFDAVEDCYSDGDHDRSERLMPDMSGELAMKAHRRIQRQVRRLTSRE